MTREEWLASEHPAAMLRHLTHSTYEEPTYGGTTTRSRSAPLASDRKLRLWGGACCRQALQITGGGQPDSFRLCDLSDQFADGAIPYSRLESFRPTHPDCSWPLRYDRDVHTTLLDVVNAKAFTPGQAALLREVVGDPFAPATVMIPPPLSGVGLAVRQVAEAAYDDRLNGGALDPLRLMILADALEESGCDNEAVLTHLRGREDVPCASGGVTQAVVRVPLRSPHVRGCWALDLILGKE